MHPPTAPLSPTSRARILRPLPTAQATTAEATTRTSTATAVPGIGPGRVPVPRCGRAILIGSSDLTQKTGRGIASVRRPITPIGCRSQ